VPRGSRLTLPSFGSPGITPPPPREICENIGADGCNLELKISSLIFKQKHSNVHQLPTSKLPSLTTDFSQLSFSN